MSKQNTTAATLYDSLSDYSLEVSEKNTPANIDRLLTTNSYDLYPVPNLTGPDGLFEGILLRHNGNGNRAARGETHYAISTPDGGWDAETAARLWANDPRNSNRRW